MPLTTETTARLRRTPLVLLVVFLTLFLLGVALDEPLRVLEQARSICLECIGIG
jgi:hypothetical protein